MWESGIMRSRKAQQKKAWVKRLLSVYICAVFLLTLFPITAFAINSTLNSYDAGGINSSLSTVASSSDTNNSITLNPGTYDKVTDSDNVITFSNKNLIISAAGNIGDVVIEGENNLYNRGIFIIEGISNITFERLIIKKGLHAQNGGAIAVRRGNITIKDCVINENIVPIDGGAIYIDGGVLNIINSTFSDNIAANWGGAIANDGGTINITDSTFTNNTAAIGGAIHNNSGTINIENSTITGDIYNETGATLNISYGNIINGIEGSGTTNYEVIYGVTGTGGSLTATAGGSPIATGNLIESGNALTFSAVPELGYRVKQWTVTQWSDNNTAIESTGGEFSIANLDSPYKITVEFEPSQTVTSVTVSPSTPSVYKGGAQQFTAAVEVLNGAAQTVDWSVDSTLSSIDANGLLSVGMNETASILTVTATSTVDPSKKDTATVTVTQYGTIYSVRVGFSVFTGSGTRSATIDAERLKFLRLLFNGNVLDPSNYTVNEGSTIITLKENFLKTLSNGDYRVMAMFTDGQAETNLVVNVTGSSSSSSSSSTAVTSLATASPQTGDNSNIALWIIINISFLLVLAGLTIWRKRKTRGI